MDQQKQVFVTDFVGVDKRLPRQIGVALLGVIVDRTALYHLVMKAVSLSIKDYFGYRSLSYVPYYTVFVYSVSILFMFIFFCI